MTLEERILALEYIYPGCERVLDGQNIVWLDTRPYPTETELQNALYQAQLEKAKREKLAIIEKLCEAKMEEGMPWDFNGVTEVIQTRPQDKVNLLGIAIEARYLDGLGFTDAFTPLRVESNVEYPITPQEGVAITSAALQHIVEKYKRCWLLKDDVRFAQTLEDVENATWYEGPLPRLE
jgi:hypothetical protein